MSRPFGRVRAVPALPEFADLLNHPSVVKEARQLAFPAIRVNPPGGMKHPPIDVRPDIDRRGHRFGLVR